MAETKKLNVRIPDQARDVLTRVVNRLREDDQFVTRLEAWLDSLDDSTADDSLAERVARIEARLDAIEGENWGQTEPGFTSTPTDTPPRDAPPDTPKSDVADHNAPQTTPPRTTGEGKGRRLTTAGELEVERRVQAGEDDATIAQALDVSIDTVRDRRRKIIERRL